MITNSKIVEYNLGYKIIDDYSYIAPYVSVATAGGVTFGTPGIFVGLGVNLIDDLLIQNNYIESKILTHSFIGFTLGYNVYPFWVSGLIGACGGLSLSQEILKNYNGVVGAGSLLGPTILGFKINGLPGVLIGSALNIADQLLVFNNITDKYYFSNSLLGITLFSAILGKSAFSYSIGGALGLIFAHYVNTTTSSLQSIKISEDLYKIYSMLIPQKQLDSYIKDYAVVLLSSQIIANQVRIILLKHEQNAMYQFEHMNDHNSNAINKLTTITLKFGWFIFPYVISELTSNILNSFYAAKLYIQIDDALISVLFANEVALRLSQDKDNVVLIDNLRLDSKVISNDGSKLIIDYIAKSINGIYGLGVLITNAPEVLVYSVLYNKGTGYISTLLSEWQNQYEVIITKQESIISSLFKHDINNIKIITETGGVGYSYNQLQIEHDKLRKYKLIKDQISHIMDAWRSFESTANFVYTYYLIGYKVGVGVVEFDNRISTHYSCLQVKRLLAWDGEKSQEIKTLYQSIERLKIFINKAFDNSSAIDNIKRAQYDYSNLLILSNLDITVVNKRLIHIDYLELKFGNIYAIEGPSGSGKSSLITKIVGITQNNVGGEGSIFYPKDAKIHLINQQDYFPFNKSLREIIFYPNDANSINHDKIMLGQQLLTKIGLTQYKFDQIEDWYSVLSGGQKREIKIISAIMQEPNILMLDEVFNGLDKKSVEILQSIITEQLPGILIISVDHNAVENNRTGFYTNSLKIIVDNLVDVRAYNNEEEPYNKLEYEDECLDNELFFIFSYDNQKCYDYEYN